MVAPAHLTVPYRELVRRTATIVLAEATRIEPLSADQTRYHFRIVETLKGTSRNAVTLTFSSGQPSLDTDFDAHRDPRFWDKRRSRQWNGGDCQMAPTFVVGATYLLFVDPPYHWKSFEKIALDEDRWLRAVRAVIRKPGSRAGFSQTVWEYLAEKKAVYVDRVSRCPSDKDAAGDPDIDRAEHIRGDTMPAPRGNDVPSAFYPCRVGRTFLTIHYEGDEPTAVPVRDGIVDFRRLETEIELVGNKRVPLRELRERLR
jgi:hypothetical protein